MHSFELIFFVKIEIARKIAHKASSARLKIRTVMGTFRAGAFPLKKLSKNENTEKHSGTESFDEGRLRGRAEKGAKNKKIKKATEKNL